MAGRHRALEEEIAKLEKELDESTFVLFLKLMKEEVECLLDSDGKKGRIIDKRHPDFGPMMETSPQAKLIVHMLGFDDVPTDDKVLALHEMKLNSGALRSFRDIASKRILSIDSHSHQTSVGFISSDDALVFVCRLGYFFFLRVMLLVLHTTHDVMARGHQQGLQLELETIEQISKTLCLGRILPGGPAHQAWEKLKKGLLEYVDASSLSEDDVQMRKVGFAEEMTFLANEIANDILHHYSEVHTDIFVFFMLTKHLAAQTNVGSLLLGHDNQRYVHVSCSLPEKYLSPKMMQSVEKVRGFLLKAVEGPLTSSEFSDLSTTVHWHSVYFLEELKVPERLMFLDGKRVRPIAIAGAGIVSLHEMMEQVGGMSMEGNLTDLQAQLTQLQQQLQQSLGQQLGQHFSSVGGFHSGGLPGMERSLSLSVPVERETDMRTADDEEAGDSTEKAEEELKEKKETDEIEKTREEVEEVADKDWTEKAEEDLKEKEEEADDSEAGKVEEGIKEVDDEDCTEKAEEELKEKEEMATDKRKKAEEESKEKTEVKNAQTSHHRNGEMMTLTELVQASASAQSVVECNKLLAQAEALSRKRTEDCAILRSDTTSLEKAIADFAGKEIIVTTLKKELDAKWAELSAAENDVQQLLAINKDLKTKFNDLLSLDDLDVLTLQELLLVTLHSPDVPVISLFETVREHFLSSKRVASIAKNLSFAAKDTV